MGKTGIIIAREFNERVRKKSFLVTTILTPLLFVLLMGGMMALMFVKPGEDKLIEVVDESGLVIGRLEDGASIRYRQADRTLEEFKADRGEAWGMLVIGSDIVANPSNVQLYTWSSSTIETEAAITRAIRDVVESERLKGYDIRNLPQILKEVKANVQLKAFKISDTGEEKESSSMLAMGLSYAFGFLMYMFILLYGAQVMNGVIEEKNSKVLEIVVSSVKPFQLMMGKITGIALVALTQFAIWAAIIGISAAAMINLMVPAELLEAAKGMAQMGGISPEMAGISQTVADNPEAIAALSSLIDMSYIGKMLLTFIIYFAGGYLLYAAMFAAVGSAVENVQDAQQFQMPVTLPLILGFVGMFSAMRDPGGAIAFWLSIIPFTSPMVMVARIPYGVPAWELLTSVGLLAVTFVTMVWLSGKIYRVGIFMYGKKPSFKELAKWITYK